VENQAIVGGLSGLHQFVRVGRLCIVGGCTKITQDCPPFMTVDGNPARVRGTNTVGLQRHNVDPRARTLLKDAYRVLYRQSLSTAQAVRKIRDEMESCEEVQALVEFVEQSERGIVK
jgi:UDP-N-acetylglucosamine acyltransferase